MTDKSQTFMLKGVSVSPGLAAGPIHVHHTLLGPINAPVSFPPGGGKIYCYFYRYSGGNGVDTRLIQNKEIQ